MSSSVTIGHTPGDGGESINQVLTKINTNFSGIDSVLSTKANASAIPTKLSTLTNDSGFVTQTGARAAISVVGGLSYNATTGVISAPSALSGFTNDTGFVTAAGARSAFSVAGGLSYNPSTGVITGPIVPTALSSFTNDAGFVTTAGARNAISVSGSLTYNASTGVISYTAPTIPTNISALTNDSGFVTASGARTAISATGSLSYNSTTGVLSAPTKLSGFTNDTGFITAAGARSAISVTGALTYDTATGILSYSPPSFGSAAFLSVGTASGTVAAGNDSRIVNAVQKDATGAVRVAATSSPFIADAYASEPGHESGKTAFSVVSSDSSPDVLKERYAAWFAYTGAGTGDFQVLGSHFALGASALKNNWYNTDVPGQNIGVQIICRGGYHRTTTDPNHLVNGLYAANDPPWWKDDNGNPVPLTDGNGNPIPGTHSTYSYNPAGDVTAIIINSVQSSYYGQNAAMEAAIHFQKNGIANVPDGDRRYMNVQLGAMRIKNPDGSSANPGIGVNVAAGCGVLDYAFQANNTARPGSYGKAPLDGPGMWTGFLRYNFDDGGIRPGGPYDAFRVDQDGSVYLSSGYTTTPSKKIRVGGSGNLEVLSHSGTVVVSITDSGNLLLGQSQGVWTTYTPAVTFDNGSTATGTAAARYTIVGKTLYVSGSYTITGVGGSPGFGLYVNLPPGMAVANVCTGFGSSPTSGKGLNIRAIGPATKVTITNIDNTSAVVNGATGYYTIICEVT
jgi:hypothetical protein